MPKKPRTIVTDHKPNFKTLQEAFKNNAVCLMDCIEKSSNEHVAVLCATVFDGKEYHFTPFAKFFNGNPYELLLAAGSPEYEEANKTAKYHGKENG